MCFSATASLTAGTTLTAISGVTLTAAHRQKAGALLAAIPLLFAIQQFIEGAIWLNAENPTALGALTLAYTFFSHILWPVFVPLAVFMIERSLLRRIAVGLCVILGACASLYFLHMFSVAPATAHIVGRSIQYALPDLLAPVIIILYGCATCVSCLFSSYRLVNLFGILNYVSALVAYQFYLHTFTSVWCFFAAIMSMVIVLHFWSGEGLQKNPSAQRRKG
jgi:hypothetical protein